MNIDFPYHLDSRGRTADTPRDDHVRDSRAAHRTNHGERESPRGSGVMQPLFAPNSPELAATVQPRRRRLCSCGWVT
jgi:hypothetical protein